MLHRFIRRNTVSFIHLTIAFACLCTKVLEIVIGAGVPKMNRRTGGFLGGVQTNFESFPPSRHSQRLTNGALFVFQAHDDDDEEDDKNDRMSQYSDDQGTK